MDSASYSVPPPLDQAAPAALKHSGLGIASFIISIVVGLALFVSFGVAAYLETSTSDGIDEKSPQAVLLGLAIVGLCLLHLVGCGLAIGALFQKDRRKVFSILGLALNGFAVLATIGLVIIGNMAN